MKTFKGFTLIELVITLAITMILLSIGMINFNVRDKIEAREQIKSLALDIKFLKNYAQVNNCKTSIKIEDDGYKMVFGSNTKAVKFNKLVKLKSTNVRNINFTSGGKPSYVASNNSAGTIIYSIGDKKSIKITVEPVTGKVNYYELKN